MGPQEEAEASTLGSQGSVMTSSLAGKLQVRTSYKSEPDPSHSKAC